MPALTFFLSRTASTGDETMNHYDRSESSCKVWNEIFASAVWNCNYFLFANVNAINVPHFALYQPTLIFAHRFPSYVWACAFVNYLPVKLNLSSQVTCVHCALLCCMYLFLLRKLSCVLCSGNALCACTMNLRHSQVEMRSTKDFVSLLTSWIQLSEWSTLFVCWTDLKSQSTQWINSFDHF